MWKVLLKLKKERFIRYTILKPFMKLQSLDQKVRWERLHHPREKTFHYQENIKVKLYLLFRTIFIFALLQNNVTTCSVC